MDGLSKLEAFEDWLREHGAGDEATPGTRSIAAGILAVAGKATVTAAHVTAGVELARDAGISDVATMERVGALLVAFDAGAPPPAVGEAPAEPVVETPPPPPAAELLPELRPLEPAPPPPPGIQISIRPSQLTPKITDEVARQVAAPPAKVSAKTPRRPTRKGPVIAGLVTIALAGGAATWSIMRVEQEPLAPREPAKPAPLAKIPELELPVAFPEGWSVIHVGTGTALLARGSEHQAFLATVPLVTPLGPGMTAEALLAVAHDAEQGAAARLVSNDARYYSEGCEAAGAGVAVCRGTATLGSDVVTLQTYLRLGARRAVLAMFMAKPSVTDPGTIDAAIVDSLVL